MKALLKCCRIQQQLFKMMALSNQEILSTLCLKIDNNNNNTNVMSDTIQKDLHQNA